MRRPAVTSCTAPPAALPAALAAAPKFGAGTRTRNPAIATATAKDGRVPALHLQAHPARP